METTERVKVNLLALVASPSRALVSLSYVRLCCGVLDVRLAPWLLPAPVAPRPSVNVVVQLSASTTPVLCLAPSLGVVFLGVLFHIWWFTVRSLKTWLDFLLS
jgi:hypothetical protein